MDPNFSFPRSTPTPRPAVKSPTVPANRESNALRASVLDAALELGIGANGAVATWMFNNALEEEDEELDEDIGRGPLSATSEEYAPYSTPPTSISSHNESLPSPFFSSSPSTTASPQVHFPPMPPMPAAPPPSNKLRKQRRDDGYESDGGYVSEGGKKSRFRTKSKTSKDSAPTSAPPISEPMELVALTKEERKRRKKADKSSKDQFETDTEDVAKPVKTKSPPKPKKTKKGSTDGAVGYETDDGYVSSSGKPKSKGRSRFFSLRRKADSASEPIHVEPVPPMPEREVFSLPIASRFATTLGSSSAAPSIAPSIAPSRSATPLLPPSRPFASSNSGSSTPSLSSSANSLLTPGDQEAFGAGSLSINIAGMHSFGDEESFRSAHTPDKSYNSTHTVTSASASQDHLSSRSLSPTQPPSSKAKFMISYPVTRTPSPGGSAPPASTAKPKHLPSPISLSPHPSNSRAPSPSPVGTPFVLVTPINTSGPPPPRAPSPAYADIVPSDDYIVSSRAGSPLPPPSPNVLAYYDVPPPSPPPNAPLPRPPRAPPSAARDPTPGLARLRSISQDRGRARHLDAGNALSGRASASPSPNPMSGRASPNPMSGRASPNPYPYPASPVGERGRAAPFPSRPVAQARATAGASVGPGLAARAKVQRYRDLYAIQIPATPVGARRPPSAGEEVGIRVEEWDSEGEGGEGEEEMLGVLGRFRSTAREQERPRALERNNSGALRPGTYRERAAEQPAMGDAAYSDDDEASRYPDEERTAGRSTMYRFDSGGGGGRETQRWSEYSSRASFMDLEKSEQARGQLVERVGVMFDLSGRERPAGAVPPVPKLPAHALMAAGGPGGNRF
ncbi:hypothetical protein DFH09DRAFT_1080325 [Mycena vulgaris]|nr:hypothetical protein DFH09DRAFT_1080325 [Mycena vulgaris]